MFVFGILKLDASPFDIPGIVACDDTFPFPRKGKVVKGATVEKMTSGCEELKGPMIDAARELEREGVVAIMGECGFMSLFQQALQESVSVPIFTSSLLLVPLVSRMIPKGKRVGILTFRSNYLSEIHFRSSGWSSSEIPVVVAGVEDQSAWQLILAPEHSFHREDLERQFLDVTRRLVRDNRNIGALVLECTLMPVFAHRIQTEINLPVFDITTLANMVAESFLRGPFVRRRVSPEPSD